MCSLFESQSSADTIALAAGLARVYAILLAPRHLDAYCKGYSDNPSYAPTILKEGTNQCIAGFSYRDSLSCNNNVATQHRLPETSTQLRMLPVSPLATYDILNKQINSRSDLKSLCLVSKELNQIALEKLYKRIDIRLFSEHNTDHMLGHMKEVKENLQYTRELVVEDECIAEETTSVQYGSVGLPDLKCWTGTGATSADPEVRDSRLEQVLDLIPANVLRTFR